MLKKELSKLHIKYTNMARLKKYSESYHKNGYYVSAPIRELGHPIPLQTPRITERIYKSIGYGNGDRVPEELVWTLYDIGLHYTEKSGTDIDEKTQIAVSGDSISPDLTQKDIQKIEELIDGHSGELQDELMELRRRITSKDKKVKSRDVGLSEDVKNLITRWEPVLIIDDDEEIPDNEFKGLYRYRSEYQKSLSSVPNLGERLREYESHPWQIKSVDTSDGLENDTPGLEFSIQVPNKEIGMSVTDVRWTEEGYDFEMKISHTGVYVFEISDGYMSDVEIYERTLDSSEPVNFDLPDEHTFYRVENEKEEIMHVLISNFAEIVPVIDGFFSEFEYYDMSQITGSDLQI